MELGISDWSKVSRTIYDFITDDNQYKLYVRVCKPTFFKDGEKVVVYETSTMEDAEEMKKDILNAFKEGKDKFIIE